MPKKTVLHFFIQGSFSKLSSLERTLTHKILFQLQFSCYSFYVGRECIIPSFRRCLSHWRHCSYKDEKTDVLSILLGLLRA